MVRTRQDENAAAWGAAIGGAPANFTRPGLAIFVTLMTAWVLTPGRRTVTRMIGQIYSTMKKFVGMTTTDGIYFLSLIHI